MWMVAPNSYMHTSVGCTVTDLCWPPTVYGAVLIHHWEGGGGADGRADERRDAWKRGRRATGCTPFQNKKENKEKAMTHGGRAVTDRGWRVTEGGWTVTDSSCLGRFQSSIIQRRGRRARAKRTNRATKRWSEHTQQKLHNPGPFRHTSHAAFRAGARSFAGASWLLVMIQTTTKESNKTEAAAARRLQHEAQPQGDCSDFP